MGGVERWSFTALVIGRMSTDATSTDSSVVKGCSPLFLEDVVARRHVQNPLFQ
jgi:hypothetical protein